MLRFKEIFTIKRILISLISLFFILFFIGGCSTIFIDPRFYIFQDRCNRAGLYIYDSKLYDEVQHIKANRDNMFKKIQNEIKNNSNTEWLSNKEYYTQLAKEYDFFNNTTDTFPFFKHTLQEKAEYLFIKTFLDKYYPTRLSNGYSYQVRYGGYSYKKSTKYLLQLLEDDEYFYIDSQEKEYIISHNKGYRYYYIGLNIRLPSDAGPGHIKTIFTETCYGAKNTFVRGVNDK